MEFIEGDLLRADVEALDLREIRAPARGTSLALRRGMRPHPPLSALDPMVFSLRNTMSVTKFAISMPTETMDQVDRAAKRLGMTRSRYIATVLTHVARRQHDAAISRRVDEVLAELDEQDLATAKHLLAARRDDGTKW